MTDTQHLLIFAAQEINADLDLSALASVGYEVTTVLQLDELDPWLRTYRSDLAMIIAQPAASEALNYASKILGAHPNIPVILVTTEIDQQFLKQALKVGVVDFLTTPVDLNVLVEAIRNAYDRQKINSGDHQFEQVLFNLNDGFILTDLNAHVLLVNHSAQQIFNLGDAQVVGKPVNQVFYHPDILDIFKPQRTFPYRNEITLEDGRVFSMQSSLILSVGIAVVMQDITHLKELNRIKTDFVNTISHDLRSPLTSIYGFIGLIDRVGPINRQQAEFIQHIQASVQHITALINDLLDLNRVESGYDLQMVEVNLQDLLTQTISSLEYQISEKMQEVTLTIPDQVPLILGNPLHLQRMVGNLIENAVKFTPPMGKIDIRCKVESNQIILEFTDNGPGIPLEDQPHIFEKFYRGSNLSQATMGTGLGLSIVKTIVEKHHGRIWVESSPQGTTFSVILPV
jgi:two-component system, OmpR family, phosphate regulon sensor histidine kinase PhoR